MQRKLNISGINPAAGIVRASFIWPPHTPQGTVDGTSLVFRIWQTPRQSGGTIHPEGLGSSDEERIEIPFETPERFWRYRPCLDQIGCFTAAVRSRARVWPVYARGPITCITADVMELKLRSWRL